MLFGKFINKIRAWIVSTRPKTLFVSVVPIVLGASIAYKEQSLQWSLSLVILITGLLIQIVTNFINEYYDYIQGVDNVYRLGPIRSIQKGFISTQEMKLAIYFIILTILLLGVYIATQTSIWIFFFAVLSILSGIFYTYSKKSIAYMGLGELFVFIFFGLVALPITYYCNTHAFSLPLLLPGSSIGLIASAVLLVNNIRDYQNDKLHSKNTLTVKIGIQNSKFLYVLFLLLPMLLSAIYFTWIVPSVFVFLWLLYGFFCYFLIYSIFRYQNPKELIPTLAKTSLLLVFYGFIFIVILFLDSQS